MFEAVLDYIARTNLFNFIIFAGIIIYLVIKLNVKENLEKGAEVVSEKIENSTEAKSKSEEKLQTIEDKIVHLEEEIEEIIKNSVDNAELVGSQVIADANKTAENIKTNAVKVVENKTGLLKNDIIKRASVASVQVAKDHIINELNNNYDLHNKLIDESIESIQNVEL